MTPRTWNYLDSELSYEHFSDANGSIFQKLKMKKIAFKVMAAILIESSLY